MVILEDGHPGSSIVEIFAAGAALSDTAVFSLIRGRANA
jgi:hypothetical protein